MAVYGPERTQAVMNAGDFKRLVERLPDGAAVWNSKIPGIIAYGFPDETGALYAHGRVSLRDEEFDRCECGCTPQVAAEALRKDDE